MAAAEADKKKVALKVRKKGRSVASLIKERGRGGGHDLKAQRSCKERKVTPGPDFLFSPQHKKLNGPHRFFFCGQQNRIPADCPLVPVSDLFFFFS